jgi:hypothetical protein
MAMALPADSLDSWVLFYKSLLDFEADDEVVLPDPYGLVKIRALRSRDSSIRLPLNISENRNTAISHALSSYRGSGVHHIAFDCDDIFAEVPSGKVSRGRLQGEGLPVADMLVECGVVASKGEARRAIEAGGIYLNNRRVSDAASRATLAEAIDGQFMVLRRGRKNYWLVRISG